MIKLLTSNPFKLAEYNSFGLKGFQAIQGPDLAEVDADSRTVILHKAKDAGADCLVEDAVLLIDGQEWSDIKFRLKELTCANKSADLVFVVNLGLNTGTQVDLVSAQLKGKLKTNTELTGFGFDDCFEVLETGMTISELKSKGLWNSVNPRLKALTLLLEGNVDERVPLDSIGTWTGRFQGT